MSELRIGEPGRDSGAAATEIGGSRQSGPQFADFLKEAIHEVNTLQHESAREIGQLLEGEVNDVHTAMLALQKADLSFQLMMQVRNKLVQAYQDILRLPV